MTETDRVFAGSIPALYDRYLGPMNFAPYAADLAARVAAGAPDRVLETACGTGVLTRALAALLPSVIADRFLLRLKRAGFNPFAPELAASDPRQSWHLAAAALRNRF
jgi:hypothetical protein